MWYPLQQKLFNWFASVSKMVKTLVLDHHQFPMETPLKVSDLCLFLYTILIWMLNCVLIKFNFSNKNVIFVPPTSFELAMPQALTTSLFYFLVRFFIPCRMLWNIVGALNSSHVHFTTRHDGRMLKCACSSVVATDSSYTVLGAILWTC